MTRETREKIVRLLATKIASERRAKERGDRIAWDTHTAHISGYMAALEDVIGVDAAGELYAEARRASETT